MKTDLLTSSGLLLLRLTFGTMMLLGHGWAKLTGFGEMAGQFADPIGLGSTTSLILVILAEVGCSVLIVLGLATRLAVIPLAVTMAVAVFIVHADDPWSKKELAAVYLSGFATLFLTGAGRFALDPILWTRFFRRRKVE
jgi:putative oxidoreductase